MRKSLLLLPVLALGLALAAASGAATHTKKKPAAAPHLCQLGEMFPKGGYVKSNCKANPIFAKTICDTVFRPQIQALAPGAAIGPGYFPSWTGDHVSCLYKVDGRPQAVMIGVGGGIAPFIISTGTGKTAVNRTVTPLQLLQWEFAQDMPSADSTCPYVTAADAAAGGPNNEPNEAPPVWTTISGYKAFTWEPCRDPQPDSPDYRFGHQFQTVVAVMAGHTEIDVTIGIPGVDVTPSQLLPFVEQLIHTYKTK